MFRKWLTFFALISIIALCYGEAETTPEDELTRDEIYNINTDMYCQTEIAIKENLLDIENPTNLYTSILGDDVNEIDCEAILKEYVLRVHKRLRKDFRKKGVGYKALNCYMNKIESLGYDKMRFKFNALYGIEIEKEKKEKLRKSINKEIGDVVEHAVEECWPEESEAKVAPVEGENNL